MNDVREFSVPPAQLSCLIGNLFAELEPPCAEPDEPEALTLCGKTPSGREAMMFVYREPQLSADIPDHHSGQWQRVPGLGGHDADRGRREGADPHILLPSVQRI